MRDTWDFWLLLAAVVAWAIFKARGVWQREVERKAEMAEEMAMFRAEEAERRAAANAPGAPGSQTRDSDPNKAAPGTPNPPSDV